MNRKIYLCLLSLVIGLLQGCPKPTIIEIYNNSGQPVSVLAASGEKVWNTGEQLSLQQGSDFFVWAQIGDHRVPFLHFNINGTEFAFRMNYLMPPAWQSGMSHRLQLERDGKLYAVLPMDAFPAKISAQPSGFPLTAGSAVRVQR